MTSVQRKFAAGLISLFVIPATNYMGQTTRLTPDGSAEPIYEFTEQTEPSTSAKEHKGTIRDVNCLMTTMKGTEADPGPPPPPPPDAGKIRKTLIEEFKRRGIRVDNMNVEFKKGNDGKTFLHVSVEVASKLSASRFNEIVNAVVNKHTTGKCKAESNTSRIK